MYNYIILLAVLKLNSIEFYEGQGLGRFTFNVYNPYTSIANFIDGLSYNLFINTTDTAKVVMLLELMITLKNLIQRHYHYGVIGHLHSYTIVQVKLQKLYFHLNKE